MVVCKWRLCFTGLALFCQLQPLRQTDGGANEQKKNIKSKSRRFQTLEVPPVHSVVSKETPGGECGGVGGVSYTGVHLS